MTTRRFTCARLLACVVAPFLVSSASAQMTKERAKAISTRLHQLQAAVKKIPAAHQLALSGNSHLLQIAKVWDNLAAQMIKNPATRPSLAGFTPNSLGGIVAVSNPATDLDFSSFAGFTQSETSTARCGNNVVVGFNDSGSVFETGFFSGG